MSREWDKLGVNKGLSRRVKSIKQQMATGRERERERNIEENQRRKLIKIKKGDQNGREIL